MGEQVLDFLLGCGLRALPRQPVLAAYQRRVGLEPLVADQQHRLGEVDRGIGRVGRHDHQRLGARRVVVVEPALLAPEQERRALARAMEIAQPSGRRARGEHRLHHVAHPRGRGEHVADISDRLFGGGERPCVVEHGFGSGRGGDRLPVGPVAARGDEAHVGQSEIEHRARGRADILAELRFDQHHCGRLAVGGRDRTPAAVGSRHQAAAAAPSRISL